MDSEIIKFIECVLTADHSKWEASLPTEGQISWATGQRSPDPNIGCGIQPSQSGGADSQPTRSQDHLVSTKVQEGGKLERLAYERQVVVILVLTIV